MDKRQYEFNRARQSGSGPRDMDAEAFRNIADSMVETYKAKNHDYGNSFELSCYEFGLASPAIRMTDKLNRFKSLIGKENEVKDESVRDTLLDLANYAIMTVMWLDKSKYNKEDK